MLKQAQAAQVQSQSLAQASEAVVPQLAAQVQQAAAVKAFDDCVFVVAVACALVILPTLAIRQRGGGSGAGPAEV
jgi:hypothetical protein